MNEILEARGKTHGSFATNAHISQAIKALIFEHAKNIPDVQREALDMIALKLSRIVSGKANVRDHWIDISGYALLAAEACDL